MVRAEARGLQRQLARDGTRRMVTWLVVNPRRKQYLAKDEQRLLRQTTSVLPESRLYGLHLKYGHRPGTPRHPTHQSSVVSTLMGHQQMRISEATPRRLGGTTESRMRPPGGQITMGDTRGWYTDPFNRYAATAR